MLKQKTNFMTKRQNGMLAFSTPNSPIRNTKGNDDLSFYNFGHDDLNPKKTMIKTARGKFHPERLDF